MASIPCPVRNDRAGCICDDNPLNNISMELTDGPYYIGYAPTPPIYQPQPGNPTQPQVPVFCVSTESQLAANQCADNATVPPPFVPPTVPGDPLNPPPQPPDTPPTGTGDPNVPIITVPPPPVSGFWNTESNCIVFCPDHSSSNTAIIPAHTIFGSTQAEADMLASNACIALARDTMVCFTPPDANTIVDLCAESAASMTVVVSGVVTSINVTGLPPGMTFSCAESGICTISGTPSCGNFTVTVTAITPTRPAGVSFDFTMRVLGITCPTVAGILGNAYSDYVFGCGGVSPYTFTPVDLGYGLTMDATGHISGTPVSLLSCPQSIPFTATVTDSEGNTCSKNCTVEISELCDCHDWAYSIDNGTSTDISGDGTATYSIVGNTYNALGTKGPQGISDPVNKGQMHLRRRFGAVAGGVNCTIRITITAEFSNPNVDNNAVVQLKYTGGAVLHLTTLFDSTGAPLVTVIPAITNASLDLLVEAICGPNVPPSGAESVNVHVTIENVSAP